MDQDGCRLPPTMTRECFRALCAFADVIVLACLADARAVLAKSAPASPPPSERIDESTSPDAKTVAGTINILRWTEDYGFLADRPPGTLTPYERIKFVALGDGGTWYASFGAEARERVERYDAPAYGIGLAGRKDFTSFATRLLAHADVNLGSGLRAFVQFGTYAETGRQPAPRPVDRGAIDIAQGFVDLKASGVLDGVVTVRVGRQQIGFGSGRLFSIRDAVNIQRSFDAAKLTYSHPGGLTFTAFYGGPVTPLRGYFDDRASTKETVGGGYVVVPLTTNGAANLDLYYFKRHRQNAAYAQGSATEERRTLGTRFWGRSGPWDYDAEAADQSGRFGGNVIRAWGVASDTGYTWRTAPLAPRLGLKVNAASGDADPKDRVLGTFDAMYPALDYLSTAAIYAPSNGIDVQPSFRLNLTRSFWTQLGVDVFYRLEPGDAFYNAVGVPIVGGSMGKGHLATTLFNFDSVWRLQPSIEVKTALTYARAEQVIRSVLGRSQVYGLAQIDFRY